MGVVRYAANTETHFANPPRRKERHDRRHLLLRDRLVGVSEDAQHAAQMPQPLPHVGVHNAANEHIARHKDALALLPACRVMLDRQQAIRVAQSVNRQCHVALLAGAHMQREPLAPLMISVFTFHWLPPPFPPPSGWLLQAA